MNDTAKTTPAGARKRGRKPKKTTANPDTEVAEDSLNLDSTPIILQLNVNAKSEEVSENSNQPNYDEKFCDYDPNVGIPNAYTENSTFESQPFELAHMHDKERTYSEDSTGARLFSQDTDSFLPVKSEHACHWCCHKFDSRCLGIPVKYKNETFYVLGNFCSMECICAYNFETNNNVNNMWEVYNLIIFMARKMNYTDAVYPAPPRKCLAMFGGYLSIEDFRLYCKSNKIVNYNNVPLIAIVDQVEEINNFYHKHKKTDLIHIDVERIKNYETKLKLQQNEYIKENYENTLNNTMGIMTS